MRTIVSIITVLVVALPATSIASDSILSGYGGPGNAEQAVLGSQLVTPPSGGSGSGGAGVESLRAASTSPAAPSSSSTPSKRQHAAPAKTPSTSKHSASAGRSGAGATPTAAPAVIAYPTRQGGTGGLPLSGSDLLLALLALGALGAGGVVLRRLAAQVDDSSSPQASAR
jgi:hypothetical protein